MGYSKKNMATTLRTAKKYLKAGFIKKSWICRSNGCATGFARPGDAMCCAEGAIILAADPYNNYARATPAKSSYAGHLIGLVDAQVSNRSKSFETIVEVNDHVSSTYGDVAKYFDYAIRELES